MFLGPFWMSWEAAGMRGTWRNAALGAVMVLGSVFVANAAKASQDPCLDSDYHWGTPVELPEFDEPIPLDGRIWIPRHLSSELPFQLRDEADGIIDLSRGRLVSKPDRSGNVVEILVYTPVEDLHSGVWSFGLVDDDGEWNESAVVDVLDEVDTEPPGVPQLTEEPEPAIGRYDAYKGGWSYSTRLWVEDPPHLLLADLRGESELYETDSLFGRLTAIGVNGNVSLGRTACGDGNWEGGDEAAEVRLGALDLAGNFSGWSEPIELEIVAGCGCQEGGPLGVPGQVTLLCVLIAAFSRRLRPTAAESQGVV